MKRSSKKRFQFTTTQLILLSFILVIVTGSVLLALPISSASGEAVSYLDALFMATTSTCVTGLVTMPTFSTWSVFGQVVILLLIQIGGLGVITIMSAMMMLLHIRLGVGDRMLIQDAFNLNTMSGLAIFVKKVVVNTLIIEGIGALFYMMVFVPEFGIKGIWISIFNAVSAFCNAGIDIIGETSLYEYVANPLINVVTMVLIILGGIGYIVWWDVIRVLKKRTPKNKRIFRYLTLHSKIAITVTVGLILGGTLLIFAFEYNNPMTIGGMSLLEKLQASLFQSVTTRTAGFATIPQENMTNASAVTSLLLMMVGGSPVGTAGGIKTVTIAVLFCSALATIGNKNSATLFGRSISIDSIKKALAVVIMFLSVCAISTILLMATNQGSALDLFYEAVSALGTVGLSRNMTASLNALGKIIIILTMYFGRVGPISFAIAFNHKNKIENVISAPTEDIRVG